MTTANPTPLRVGQTGLLDGHSYTVAGRVVLSTRVQGGTYFWNEFNLVDGSGGAATLVYEDDDNGPEWKLFRLFEPLRPMTATEAAAIRVGADVRLDGLDARVSLVSESRVEFIEGTAPEGVEVGDVACYFNADSTTRDRMLVASWTGPEIEFYQGSDLSAHAVATAFSLSLDSLPRPAFRSRGDAPAVLKALVIAGAMLFLAFIFYGVWTGGDSPTSAPPPKQAAPAQRLGLGANGALGATVYSIAGHSLVEVAGVGGKFERHEYDLVADGGVHALLIQGLDGNAKDWRLFTPVSAPSGLTPFAAAALRPGQTVSLGSHTFSLSGVFLCQTESGEGQADPNAKPGTVRYGFVARSDTGLLLARWTESGLQLHLGQTLPESDVLATMGAGPEPTK